MSLPAGIRRIDPVTWELPRDFRPGMLVPGRIFASEELLRAMDDGVFRQVANVACLPGIIDYAYCMPDGHWGYGFPIGGLAAMDPASGVISPGGIGFDINCGMRLVRTNLTEAEVRPVLERLLDGLFRRIPVGIGGQGGLPLKRDEFRRLLQQGSRWCLRHGYAWPSDLERTEEEGCFGGADATAVSDKAVERGFQQVGSLGSGNHYLEIQVAHPDGIFDQELATAFGIDRPDQVLVMFHCGSRGFGHQVATDYLQRFLKVMGPVYGLRVPDRDLACAPFTSPEGQAYFAAMQCAVNMAFANRQLILHGIREVFSDVFRRPAEELGLEMVYDVAHNTAKLERHLVAGKPRELLVHRKGATRAFGPGMPGLPDCYQKTGQPVIIGGSMETGSYLLAGTSEGGKAFFTTAHGSGRTMSRHEAKKRFRGEKLQHSMAEHGISIRCASWSGLAEEAGAAYKDINQVVAATERAGLSRRVARLVPIGNLKG